MLAPLLPRPSRAIGRDPLEDHVAIVSGRLQPPKQGFESTMVRIVLTPLRPRPLVWPLVHR
jgi:hypothetical protein